MTDSGGTRTAEIAVLCAGLLLAVSTVGFAVGGPTSASPYTEFSVLSPDGGDLLADDYPTVGDANGTVVTKVTNHQREQTTYTLVATAQHVAANDGSSTEVLERHELGRQTLSLPDGDAATARFDVLALGDLADAPRVRVVFSLYVGNVSDDTPSESPYRQLHLWVADTDRDSNVTAT
ncbi:DUF1616 domain-containing protein [Halobaculum marinum]|uniref:DUF1616 domain-containing protein n=1 Tax=Halobaculum marinum TaxID=3031996 RepID=A0ABD5WW86_9EURY|nr:DUF1616 domain-containing protein [Halobaculum sp. DT55]